MVRFTAPTSRNITPANARWTTHSRRIRPSLWPTSYSRPLDFAPVPTYSRRCPPKEAGRARCRQPPPRPMASKGLAPMHGKPTAYAPSGDETACGGSGGGRTTGVGGRCPIGDGRMLEVVTVRRARAARPSSGLVAMIPPEPMLSTAVRSWPDGGDECLTEVRRFQGSCRDRQQAPRAGLRRRTNVTGSVGDLLGVLC
jgi:hypothetical protein